MMYWYRDHASYLLDFNWVNLTVICPSLWWNESVDTNIFIISFHCCDILNNWMYRLKPLSRSSDRREISARKRIFSTFKATPKGEYPLCVYLDWSHYVLLKKSGLRATAVLLLWSTCTSQTSNQEVRGAAILWLASSPAVRVFGLTQLYLHTEESDF